MLGGLDSLKNCRYHPRWGCHISKIHVSLRLLSAASEASFNSEQRGKSSVILGTRDPGIVDFQVNSGQLTSLGTQIVSNVLCIRFVLSGSP